MTGGVIVITNEEDLCPKILVQCVLGSNNGEIIAGRDNATIQHDEITVIGGEDDGLLRAATESDAGEEDGGVIRNFT